LRAVAGQIKDHLLPVSSSGMDDMDGFEPVRTPAPEVHTKRDNAVFHRYAAETCISFLVMAPALQSTSAEPTRDKELTDLVLRSEPSQLHLTAPIFFDHIRRRLLKISVTNLDDFFLKLGTLLQKYNYARSEKLQMLVCHVLDTTSHIWLQEPARNGEVGSKARSLCHWLSNMLMENKIRSWQLRDHLACFLDRYLSKDPTQEAWSLDGTPNGGSFPAVLLPMLGADPDIRVRFRAAVFNARLFSISKEIEQETLILYTGIRKSLTVDLQEYVHP
jgi:ataxia telangiectasia mutated family protein